MLNDDVYQTLKRDILSLRLAPGTALFERVVAQTMNVSRTPVREAFHRLGADGLIKRYPSRGVVVSELLLRDVVEAFQVREFIEPPAAAIAARTRDVQEVARLIEVFERLMEGPETREAVALHNDADARVHSLVIEATGNSRLQTIMANLSDICQRARYVGTPIRFTESVAEHLRLLQALRDGDAERAVSAMQDHLAAARQRLSAVI